MGKGLPKTILPCPIENSIAGDLNLVVKKNLPD